MKLGTHEDFFQDRLLCDSMAMASIYIMSIHPIIAIHLI